MRTEFDCTIPARHGGGTDGIRTFASAITALAKIGTSVCFEASGRALRLRTWNDAKTAFLVFVFENSFFESYVQLVAPLSPRAAARCR